METFVNSNGVRIWTTRSGTGGVPILLCNGGPGCCDYLEPVANMIDDIAPVIRFEQRGCGRSESTGPYDIETCLFDLEAIRNHYGIDRWIVGGHSWGADLALIYALEHTERVAGLICISGGRMHNDREWHSEYERRKKLEGERSPDFKYPTNLEVNRLVNQAWKHYIQNPELFRKLSELKIPAVFVYGDRDIRPSWPIQQIANLMPNARFEMIEGAEHIIWFSHEQELESILREFIQRVPLASLRLNMTQEPDFFLDGEGEGLNTIYACWRRKRLRDNVRDDYLLVDIEPPMIGQKYGLGGEDITQLILATRHQGVTLFPVTEWPAHVFVCRILDEGLLEQEVFEAHQIQMIAWAVILPSPSDLTI